MINRFLKFFISTLENVYIKQKTRDLINSFGKYGSENELCFPFDIRGSEYIEIGNRVFIGPRVLIGAAKGAEVIINDDVLFGPEVKLIAGDHRFDIPSVLIRDSGSGRLSPIIIKRGAWIGAAAIILKGVTIGEGAIVGAGSVVARNVPSFEIWAGNPARLIKKRFTYVPYQEAD